MNLAQLTSADLKNIAKLLERRESLRSQVAEIDGELTRFESNRPIARALAAYDLRARRRAQAPRAARGSVKAAIVQLLQGAGTTGMTVKDIAARLGVKYNRVFTWFYNTGRTINGITKVGPGTYAWTGGSTPAPKSPAAAKPPVAAKPVAAAKPPVATKPAAAPKGSVATKPAAPAKSKKPRAKQPKGKQKQTKQPKASQHGELKDLIVGLVKAGGKAGIAAKDVATKLKSPPARIYNWFQTTGKKVKQIKKVGRGKYAWAG